MPPSYFKEYYQAHKGELKRRAIERYYHKRESILAKQKADYLMDKDKILTRNKRYFDANREKVLNHRSILNRNYLLELRADILKILGGKCVHCGFEDARVLQIDHINNDGNKEMRLLGGARNSLRYYRHIMDNIANYQLLCANCNWIKELLFRKSRSRYYRNNLGGASWQ